MVKEIFDSNYFRFANKNDFSFRRKKIHPILNYPQTSSQMIRMKVNIRYIINELPVKEFLNKKDIEADNSCDMCNLHYRQTTEHVLTLCQLIINDPFIVRKWKEISDFLMVIFQTDQTSIDSYFNDQKFRFDINKERHFRILDLNQDYLNHVYTKLKKFQRIRNNANPSRQRPKEGQILEEDNDPYRNKSRQHKGKKLNDNKDPNQPTIDKFFKTKKHTPFPPLYYSIPYMELKVHFPLHLPLNQLRKCFGTHI